MNTTYDRIQTKLVQNLIRWGYRIRFNMRSIVPVQREKENQTQFVFVYSRAEDFLSIINVYTTKLCSLANI